jgi:GT2 family glycosyltransferase
MRISIIVPVHDGAEHLPECLSALRAPSSPPPELVVVDDGSTDEGAALAAGLGARVERLASRRGPAAARNVGARRARGDVLLFVDADVVLAPGAVDRVARAFEADPALAAVFGSYDAHPRARGLVSQYRNLLHHFVHQRGNPEASTFWAGCGAVRRDAFEALGGFDERRFPHPSIEDIDLGVRLRRAGHRIRLDRELQGTHLKRWTLWSMVRTDVLRRAVPWSRLVLETGRLPDDLNLRYAQRWSVALVGLAAILVPLALIRPAALLAAAGALAASVVLNRDLFAFFARARGPGFAAACVPLHWLHYLASGLSFLGVWVALRRRGRREDPALVARSQP